MEPRCSVSGIECQDLWAMSAVTSIRLSMVKLILRNQDLRRPFLSRGSKELLLKWKFSLQLCLDMVLLNRGIHSYLLFSLQSILLLYNASNLCINWIFDPKFVNGSFLAKIQVFQIILLFFAPAFFALQMSKSSKMYPYFSYNFKGPWHFLHQIS